MVMLNIAPFFDAGTNSFSYIVREEGGSACAVVDSVLCLDYASGRLDYGHADQIVSYITDNNLSLQWLIETHVHADHLTAAPYIQARLGGKIGISSQITQVQRTFAEVFNEGVAFKRDGSEFDHLFGDGETYRIGGLEVRVVHTPGHTPACSTHLIEDAAFVGDTLFMPDCGTARADFPGGDARQLYRSIRMILSLPGETKLFMCHDYPQNGRKPQFQTTVAEQRRLNIHVRDGIDEEQFVELRTKHDATLQMPNLILPALQINMKAGALPPVDLNGKRFLRIPLNGF